MKEAVYVMLYSIRRQAMLGYCSASYQRCGDDRHPGHICHVPPCEQRADSGLRLGPPAAPPPSTSHLVLWHPLMIFAQINTKSRIAKWCGSLFCSLLVSIILPALISWHTSVKKSCPSPLRPDIRSVMQTYGHSGKVIDASSFPCNLPVISN